MIIFDARRRQSARCLPKSRRWVVFLWRYSARQRQAVVFSFDDDEAMTCSTGKVYGILCSYTARETGNSMIGWFPIFFFFYCPSTFVLLGNDRSMMGELKILPHVYNIVIISRSAIDAAHATWCAPIGMMY